MSRKRSRNWEGGTQKWDGLPWKAIEPPLERDDGWQSMGGEEQALLYTLEEISGSDYCLREDPFGGSQMVLAGTTSAPGDEAATAPATAPPGTGDGGDGGDASGNKKEKKKGKELKVYAAPEEQQAADGDNSGGGGGGAGAGAVEPGAAVSAAAAAAVTVAVSDGTSSATEAMEDGGDTETAANDNKGPKKKKRRGQGKKKRAAEAALARAAAAADGSGGGSPGATVGTDGAPPTSTAAVAVRQHEQQHAGEQTTEAAAASAAGDKPRNPDAANKDTKKKRNKKKKKKKKKKAQGEEEEEGGSSGAAGRKSQRDWELGEEEAAKMAPWMYLGVELHPALLWHLHRQGFHDPTPIQRRVLPKAVLGRKDIIGAAETGSGKTLAFGLPVLSEILTRQDSAAAAAAATLEAKSEPVGAAVGGGGGDGVAGKGEEEDGAGEGLQALVLCPTRELALQVAAHLREVVRDTGLAVVPVVGGLAEVKQQRQLSRRPEVVVATPGRFWEMAGSHAHLSRLENLRHLVVDEADRMLERGHYPELSRLFSMLEKAEGREAEGEGRGGGGGGSGGGGGRGGRFKKYQLPFDIGEGGE